MNKTKNLSLILAIAFLLTSGCSKKSKDQPPGSEAISSILTDGIIGLWHLDEPSGTAGGSSVIDDSGNGFHGTPLGGVTFGLTGKFGKAASFANASTQYVNIGDMGALPTTGTISFWIYPTVIQDFNNPFSTGGLSNNNTGFRFEENNGNLTFNVGDDIGTHIQPILINGISANAWYNITLTWDVTQSLVWVYVNGSLTANPTTTTFPSGLGTVSIGTGYTPPRSWDGLIDEVGIWSRALSAAEVLKVYQSGIN